MAYDGIPAGLRFQLNTSGSTFTDISSTIPRQSVQFSRGKPGEPGTVTFECLPNGAGWNIAEWQELRIDDVTDPGSPYPRLGVYYIMDFDAGKDGAEKTYNVTAYDQNILLTRGPNQILGEIIVGARPYRTATTAYIVGDVVEPTKAKLWAASTAYALNALIEPTTANRHYYKCTTAGTTGGSEPVWTQVSGGTTTSGTAVFTEQGTTENGHIYRCTVAGTTGATVPTFPTGTGATVADGTVTWTEFGAVTHTDKQAVEYLVNNYLPECGTAVNQVIGSLTAIALEDESLASALAKIALQSSPSFYDGWEALKPYVAGNMILASPDNGYYYECTTAGTSGSSVPGVWGTALGDTVSSGSAVFTNRGSSTTMPFALVTVDPDNAGHTAAWAKKVGWYDANSEIQVPTLTIEYSDQTSEDATHIHYEPASKRKRDAQALRNRQTVRGSLSATYTMDDTVSQTALGRVISGPVYKDDKITTNAQAQARASALLGALGTARETITLTSHRAPSDAYTLFVGARKIKFTRATDGLSSQPYPNTRVGLSFPNGVAKWTFELGATLLTQGQDPITGISAGARFVGDTVAPGVPSWPTGTTWILQNSIDWITGLCTNIVQWNPPTTGLGDLKWYQVKYRRSDQTYDQYSALIPKATTTFELRSLPAGINVNYYVRAIDTSGNGSAFTSSTQQLTTPTRVYTGVPNPSFEYLDALDPTKPAEWSKTLVAGGTAILDTTAIDGTYGIKMATAGGGTDSASWTCSNFVIDARPGGSFTFTFFSKASFSSTSLGYTITWKDYDGTVLGTSTGTVTATTGWTTHKPVVTPTAGTKKASIKFTNSNTSARNIWVDLVGLTAQRTTDDLENGAVTDAKVTSITTATKLPVDIETNPFDFFDSGGNYRGRLQYVSSGGADRLRFTAANATSATQMRIEGGTSLSKASIDLDDNGIYFRSDTLFKFGSSTSVVTAEAALATSATDGFLYIPTCAGAPSGVPTSHTGTIALVYDTSNNNLYVYNGAWKKVGLT